MHHGAGTTTYTRVDNIPQYGTKKFATVNRFTFGYGLVLASELDLQQDPSKNSEM
jgi:hypothetical protein